MRRWHVCIPAWGVDYIDKFVAGPAQCLSAALRYARRRAVLIIATDNPKYLQSQLSKIDMSRFDLTLFRLLERHRSKYETFGVVHRAMLSEIAQGQYASLLAADMSVSIEFFKACEARLKQGFEMVAGFGPSTLPPYPQPGMTGRALLETAMARLHPRHANHIWPARTPTPSMFILKGAAGGHIAHSFHQHPFALKITANLARWQGGTCDAGLEDIVGAEKIHTVTSPYELAAIETSPPDERFSIKGELAISDVVGFGRRSNPTQRKLFERRMVLTGPDETFIHQQKIDSIILGLQQPL